MALKGLAKILMALRELAYFYCNLVQQLNLLGPRMTAVAIVTDFTKGRGSSSIQIQVGLFRLLLLPCELVVPCYRFHPVERSCRLQPLASPYGSRLVPSNLDAGRSNVKPENES